MDGAWDWHKIGSETNSLYSLLTAILSKFLLNPLSKFDFEIGLVLDVCSSIYIKANGAVGYV